MSLYNMLFGMNPDSDKLLSLLGKTQSDFGRFRDAYLMDGNIVVHTRCGGGNREDYESVFEEMSAHPWYVNDEDDDYDCTYADIVFKVPDSLMEEMKEFEQAKMTPAEKWDAVMKALDQK